ncbi:hypothetical protein XENORESO_018890 [Xenotaenia resolanae]|uniref:Uncharacterized protein n=1 Tax=Xenotaenia resolanae TaxID=208358 RepID=A0ABV0VZY5_9TELE
MDILTSLYKNLLDDKTFLESLMALAFKPPAYQPHPSTNPSSILPSSPQPPVLVNGTVDGERATGCSETISRTQTTHWPDLAPVDVIEDILLNTLQNIMMEAVRGELVLTAHPNTIMLPPFSVRRGQALAEEDQ